MNSSLYHRAIPKMPFWGVEFDPLWMWLVFEQTKILEHQQPQQAFQEIDVSLTRRQINTCGNGSSNIIQKSSLTPMHFFHKSAMSTGKWTAHPNSNLHDSLGGKFWTSVGLLRLLQVKRPQHSGHIQPTPSSYTDGSHGSNTCSQREERNDQNKSLWNRGNRL